MRTISLRQPWAFLLCSGIKDIENRTWKLPEKYKDKWVLIHASTNIRKSTKDLLNKEQFDIILGLSSWDKKSTLMVGRLSTPSSGRLNFRIALSAIRVPGRRKRITWIRYLWGSRRSTTGWFPKQSYLITQS